jgi:hypothetical protein
MRFHEVYPGLRVKSLNGALKGREEGMVREVNGTLKTMTIVFDDQSIEEFAKPSDYGPAPRAEAN